MSERRNAIIKPNIKAQNVLNNLKVAYWVGLNFKPTQNSPIEEIEPSFDQVVYCETYGNKPKFKRSTNAAVAPARKLSWALFTNKARAFASYLDNKRFINQEVDFIFKLGKA